MTAEEQRFCLLYVQYGSSADARRDAYAAAFQKHQKTHKTTLTRLAKELMERADVKAEIRECQHAQSSVFRTARRDVQRLGFQVEKDRLSLQSENYRTLLTITRAMRERAEVDPAFALSTAEAKLLDTNARIVGDIGGAQLTISMPDGAAEGVEDVDAEIAALQQEILDSDVGVRLGPEPENAPKTAGEAIKRGYPTA